jgi:hypothetical protein
MAQEHERCFYYKRDLIQCNRRLFEDEERRQGMCNRHIACYQRVVEREGIPRADQCIIALTTGRWCPRDRRDNNSRLCDHHFHRMQAEVARRAQAERAHQEGLRRIREQRELSTTIINGLLVNNTPLDEAFIFVANLENVNIHTKRDISVQYYLILARNGNMTQARLVHFNQVYEWAANPRRDEIPRPDLTIPPFIAAAPQVQQGLGRIANDRQNVHTREISNQTNEIQKKLFEKGGDDNRNRGKSLVLKHTSIWLHEGWVELKDMSSLFSDIHRFYSLTMLRIPNDFLYRRLLNATVTCIEQTKPPELALELSKRLCQECIESIGMCTEGHITRLCNVFVGFDETFSPPVPIRELLQQKLGMISLMEISTEEKIAKAKEVFTELKLPEADQSVWLEAF